MPLLLDSGSMVSLVQQDYFVCFLRLKPGPLKGPVTSLNYFEMDEKFLGLKVPKIGFFVTQSPSDYHV